MQNKIKEAKKPKEQKTTAQIKAQARAERLALQLRQNMHKRKAQKRVREMEK